MHNPWMYGEPMHVGPLVAGSELPAPRERHNDHPGVTIHVYNIMYNLFDIFITVKKRQQKYINVT